MFRALQSSESHDATLRSGRGKRTSFLRRLIGVLILWVVLCVAGLLIFGGIGRYKVISNSMYPTLHIGDFVLANQSGSYEPQRGDIIVFGDPDDRYAEKTRDRDRVTKRVAAVPGDTVEVLKDGVWINQEEFHEAPSWKMSQSKLRERTFRLKDGQYFLMGDNQSNSHDSLQFGPVDRELIIGHVLLVYWPLSHAGRPDSTLELRAKELQ
ncbi:signal peptidase I [Candidatus Sumerlaeota bacterium]|nr:signal peptidase I [Candidatus Sumerlaeota bacterium]